MLKRRHQSTGCKYTLLITGAVSILSSCSPSAQNNPGAGVSPAKAIKLSELKLSNTEAELSASPDFEFFPGGHFGEKTQYNGRIADESGGAYAVHCRKGLPFSIEVKYQDKGIPREQALKIMQKLLPDDAGELIEHDDEDLQKMDAPQAAEFFYYKGGPRTELLYATDSNKNVVQINIWTKDG